jgi:hypothetical protein
MELTGLAPSILDPAIPKINISGVKFWGSYKNCRLKV